MEILKPKFSLIVANYNTGQYIEEAIKSVLNQTFGNWEMIIGDDTSSDNSVDVIKKFLVDERINLIQNGVRLGYIGNLRNLIGLARGEILVILDGDDALAVEALEELNNAYNEHPDCGFIYSQFVICDKDLQPLKIGYCKKIPLGRSNIHKDYSTHLKSYKKEIFLKTTGFDDEILYAEDRDIILKIEEQTNFFFVDKILYFYRRVPLSQTTDFRKKQIGRISRQLAKYNAYQRRQGTSIPNLTKSEMSSELLAAIPSCFKLGDFRKMKFFVKESFKIAPYNLLGYCFLFFRLFKFPFNRLYRLMLRNKNNRLCDM